MLFYDFQQVSGFWYGNSQYSIDSITEFEKGNKDNEILLKMEPGEIIFFDFGRVLKV